MRARRKSTCNQCRYTACHRPVSVGAREGNRDGQQEVQGVQFACPYCHPPPCHPLALLPRHPYARTVTPNLTVSTLSTVTGGGDNMGMQPVISDNSSSTNRLGFIFLLLPLSIDLLMPLMPQSIPWPCLLARSLTRSSCDWRHIG